MSILLEETFVCSGTELQDFRDSVKEITDATGYLPINLGKLELLSFVGTVGEGNERRIVFAHHIPGQASKRSYIELRKLLQKGATMKLIGEMMERNKLMLRYDGVLYFTSEWLMTTLSNRTQIGGKQFTVPTVKRDEYISEVLGLHPINATLMYREVKGVRKAFSVFSPKYNSLRQTCFADIIEELGELGTAKVVGWEMDHQLTSASVEFADKARDIAAVYGLPDQVIPGLTLRTSDTGYSSLTCIGTMKVKNSLVYTDVFRQKHMGELDEEKLLAEIQHKIFSRYTLVPQKLCELLMVPVEKPKDVIESVFRQGMSRDMTDMLLTDMQNAITEFEKLEYPTQTRVAQNKQQRVVGKVFTHTHVKAGR